MKKILAVALCFVMLFTLAACNAAQTPNNTEGSSSTAPNGASANWDGKSALEIMQTITQNADIQIMTEVMDGSEFYLNALTLGELNFKEIAICMPMISSQRFEAAVIRVQDGTDVAAYVSDLEQRAANAQWICASPPDYVKVTAVGDCVLYLAVNSEFANEEAMVEAFRNPAI